MMTKELSDLSPEEKHLACLRRNWPSDLRDRALPSISTYEVPTDSLTFMVQARSALPLASLIQNHPSLEEGLFLKCAGFSFKEVDAFHMLGNGRVAESLDIQTLLGAGLPRRMFWAINAHVDLQKQVELEVLSWQEIEPQQEFRVFIVDGEIKGISQYHRHFKLPDSGSSNDLQALVDRIGDFCRSLRDHLPPFDLAVDVIDDGHEAVLLELNPLTRRTDLGLFNYSSVASGQGELRFR